MDTELGIVLTMLAVCCIIVLAIAVMMARIVYYDMLGNEYEKHLVLCSLLAVFCLIVPIAYSVVNGVHTFAGAAIMGFSYGTLFTLSVGKAIKFGLLGGM